MGKYNYDFDQLDKSASDYWTPPKDEWVTRFNNVDRASLPEATLRYVEDQGDDGTSGQLVDVLVENSEV